MMVDCQWNKSSPTGPALQVEGGSLFRSCSSLLMRFVADLCAERALSAEGRRGAGGQGAAARGPATWSGGMQRALARHGVPAARGGGAALAGLLLTCWEKSQRTTTESGLQTEGAGRGGIGPRGRAGGRSRVAQPPAPAVRHAPRAAARAGGRRGYGMRLVTLWLSLGGGVGEVTPRAFADFA